MANNSVKQSTHPKPPKRPDRIGEEELAKEALRGLIDGDSDPKRVFREVPEYDPNPSLEFPRRVDERGREEDVVKRPRESYEAGPNMPLKGPKAKAIGDSMTRKLAPLAPSDEPLTPEEEEALIRLLSRTARPS